MESLCKIILRESKNERNILLILNIITQTVNRKDAKLVFVRTWENAALSRAGNL